MFSCSYDGEAAVEKPEARESSKRRRGEWAEGPGHREKRETKR